MAIITVEELETALGRDLTTTEEAQAQHYINYVSAAVETFTGVSFTLHTEETVRQQSDYYGQIHLKPEPVIEVGDVTRVFPPSSARFYGWDGFNVLYNLEPHTAYDVVLTYGYETPPEDIKGYVTEVVKLVTVNPNMLESFRVGDVTETYSDNPEVQQQAYSIAMLGKAVLESYKRTEETWRLGPRAFTHRPELPTL